MAQAGDVIDNPVTGERITFLRTARETAGASVMFELVVQPGGTPVAAHIHPTQTERFEVVRGTFSAWIDGRAHVLAAGEELTVPAATPHLWKNLTAEPLHLRVEFRPALRWEALFETMFGLARDGKTDKQGRPGVLQTAVIFNEFRREAAPVSAVDRMLFSVLPLLGLLGRTLGYKPTYPEYTKDPV